MGLVGDALSRAESRTQRFFDLPSEYASSTPPTPKQGIRIFTRNRARRLPAFVGPAGQDSQLQPAFFSNRVAQVDAINNATTPDIFAMAVTHLNNATSTPTAVANAGTNFFTSMVRYRCGTTTTAGTGAGTRSASGQWMLSSGANKGGFFFVARFGFNLIAAGSRAFIGLSTTTAALSPTVDPSTLFNQIGFGFDAADTNIQFMRNDGSGTSPKVDTGFAKGTGAADFYEMRLFAPSGGGQIVFWSAQRLNDGAFIQGSAAVTDLPAVDTLLVAHVHLSNGAVAAAHSVDIQKIYVETDN